MTTQHISDQYDLSMTAPRKVAKGYEVEGTILDRRTGKATKVKVHGEGRTMASAQSAALVDARRKCPSFDDDE